MKLSQDNALIAIPDGVATGIALQRTSHLGIGAHADDLEVMAIDGILHCFDRDDRWFCGVVVSDGAGSPRSGPFAGYSDEQLREVRRQEQLQAAELGRYGAQILLDHSSAAVKDPGCPQLSGDLAAVLAATRPEVVYTHSPADRHDTHVAVTLRVVDAIRSLPPEHRPARLYGCEVWGDLDWLHPDDRVVFDLSRHQPLQAALLEVFASQISSKRYDLAAIGRRLAHATFQASHQPDAATSVSLAIDLSPLISDDRLSLAALTRRLLERFTGDVLVRLGSLG